MYSENTVSALVDLYCFYHQKYVVMTPTYTKMINHYFRDGVIRQHLDGAYAVCVFAGPRSTKFLSFDVDDGGKDAVRSIIDALVEFGIPRDHIYISTSGRKGYHVDIFFETGIYNTKARNLYSLVIWRTGLDPKKVEYRPTAAQAIKLPLGVHAKTGNRCWYLDQETLEPIEDMDYILGIRRLSPSSIDEILMSWNKRRWNELYIDCACGVSPHMTNRREQNGKNDMFRDTSDFTLREPGERHHMMLAVARDARVKGANAAGIYKKLMEWYAEQDPAMIGSEREEVEADAHSIAKWTAEKIKTGSAKVRYVSQSNPIINKYDIYQILKGKTTSARKIAMMIVAYCRAFGTARLSNDRIGEVTGCSHATVLGAVRYLVNRKVVNRESGGLRVNHHSQMIKLANEYTLPQRRVRRCPGDGDVIAEERAFTIEEVERDFDLFYFRTLGHICTDEYLAQYLKKAELERVKGARAA